MEPLSSNTSRKESLYTKRDGADGDARRDKLGLLRGVPLVRIAKGGPETQVSGEGEEAKAL